MQEMFKQISFFIVFKLILVYLFIEKIFLKEKEIEQESINQLLKVSLLLY